MFFLLFFSRFLTFSSNYENQIAVGKYLVYGAGIVLLYPKIISRKKIK